jgi:hypothetical protein
MSPLTDVQLARRATWRMEADPTTCRHARGFYEPLGPRRVRKRCRRCGATLTEGPRCPSVVASGRQCLLSVQSDLGYSTCAAHAVTATMEVQ